MQLFTNIIISFILLFILMLFFPNTGLATHNRAGEIRIVQELDYASQTIKAIITTYTKASSVDADRNELTINWGDGNSEVVFRSNGPDNNNDGVPDGESLPNDTKINIYFAFHTFPSLGQYTISMTDPNRNADILNIDPPNSIETPFHIHTNYTLFNPQQQGINSTPELLQAPIDVGCVGQVFIHNPNAYDIDGDSLAYEMIVPLEGIAPQSGQPIQVPLYSYPDEIEPGADNIWTLDNKGDFVWNAPQKAGEYNIAMIIIEYRNGLPIDTTIRDMQILIKECDNNPPEVLVMDEICVVAGEKLVFEVIAKDDDEGQMVNLTAEGGPLVATYSPATFTVVSGFQIPELTGTFEWQTSCEHISEQPYTVVFRSSDNYIICSDNNSPVYLSTLRTVRIKVVGPPPEEVEAEALTEQISVSWASPYTCEETENDFFRGFSVWRRNNSNQFNINCTPGLDGKGYTQISLGVTQELDPDDPNRYAFFDMDVERGKTYCYRILAEFANLTTSGIPFNRVESLPSEEVCVQLDRNIPLITRVSVLETNTISGQIEVKWTKPDLDTTLSPGPYRYEVYRATGMEGNNMQPIPGASFVSEFFANANDTSFLDMGLNTQDIAYTYEIAFYVEYNDDEVEPFGFTTPAASVYLDVASTDEINELSWDENIPWDNYSYVIYRKNDQGSFDSIGISDIPFYSDEGLTNGIEYCYYVRTIGTYGLNDIGILMNLSQEACGIPLDTIPPCPPVLMISNICDEATDETPESSFINILNWTNPNVACPETDDVVQYEVYYTAVEGGNLQPIDMINFPTDTTYEHQPEIGIAGCYAVTATDSVGNQSGFSNIVCVDNCPFYQLPNAFTPNDDSQNDFFVPYPYRFIAQIDIKIFDRWGGLVFETTNPAISWDGTNTSSKDVAEGVYFYTCSVFEQRVNGVIKNLSPLSGYIHLVRN